jgi:dTDP-4-amino-4,6-dideoxygalactose transaminase
MAKGAEEDFFGIERHEYRVDPVNLYNPVAEWTRAVVIAHGNGKVEFRHKDPG